MILSGVRNIQVAKVCTESLLCIEKVLEKSQLDQSSDFLIQFVLSGQRLIELMNSLIIALGSKNEKIFTKTT